MAYEVEWELPGEEKTLDVGKVVELEQAIAADGLPLAELMDRAGASVAAFVQHRWEPGGRVAVFCGKGNNGGDGWVAARLLALAGYTVRLVTPCTAGEVPAHPAQEAALACMEAVHSTENLALYVLPDAEGLQRILAASDVVVDALLGTGFHYASLHEPTASWVAAIQASRADGGQEGEGPAQTPARPIIVSVDVPSGLNAQDGTAADPCIAADFTVTMMAKKTGMATPEGARLSGEVHVARIAPIERYL